jgi:hypothetical protein
LRFFALFVPATGRQSSLYPYRSQCGNPKAKLLMRKVGSNEKLRDSAGKNGRADSKDSGALFYGDLIVTAHADAQLAKFGADNLLPAYLNE